MKENSIKKNNILVVDGTNLIFRNHFVHTYRKTSSGISTGGLYGTIRSLKSYAKTFNPRQIFICFDKSSSTFRKKIYPEYKAKRKKTDKELLDQFPVFKEYCKLANIPFIEMDNYEADDLIGSLSCNAKRYGLNPYAVTGDKDILQLLSKNIEVLYLSRSGPIIYREEDLLEEYNISKEQFIDYKALVGDPSDNIPGVPMIGKVTAAKLLGEYKNLDGIYENVEELGGKQKENILKYKEEAYLYQELLSIVCDLDLDYNKYFNTYVKEGFDLTSRDSKDLLKKLEI